jgi:hypothetical protein
MTPRIAQIQGMQVGSTLAATKITRGAVVGMAWLSATHVSASGA